MIKLQDFARQQGVTDRAVQKLLKKYEAELAGTFERKGPNGTWLTDEACEILRSKMKQQPLTVYDEDPRVGQLQERVADLERRIDEKDKLLAIANQQVQDSQGKVAELQAANAKVALLEAGNQAAEAKVADLEGRLEAERQATAGANERAERAEQACRDLDAQHHAEVEKLTELHKEQLLAADVAKKNVEEELAKAEQDKQDLQDDLDVVARRLVKIRAKTEELADAKWPWQRKRILCELKDLQAQAEKE